MGAPGLVKVVFVAILHPSSSSLRRSGKPAEQRTQNSIFFPQIDSSRRSWPPQNVSVAVFSPGQRRICSSVGYDRAPDSYAAIGCALMAGWVSNTFNRQELAPGNVP